MKKIIVMLLAASLLLAGCGAKTEPQSTQPAPPAQAEQAAPETPEAPEAPAAAYEDGVVMRVASLSGPTSMGLAALASSENEHYQFDIYTAANEILPTLVKEEVDAALIPSNLAANVYNQTGGAVRVLNINTLGVLEVVASEAESIDGMADLAGRTVYLPATGKGATPEYAARTLLAAAGVDESAVTLDFSNPEPAAVVAALTADPSAIAILPQPFATVAVAQSEGKLALKLALDEEWAALMQDGSRLVTGVTVVSTIFLEEHPAAVAQFALDQAASVEQAVSDPAAVAPLIEALGIVKAPIAQKALPRCHLAALDGDALKTALSAYLETLYAFDPAVVGGALPGDDFYVG